MTKRSLFLIGFVSACSLALAGTKSYVVAFDKPEGVGAVQLTPGEYKLTVENGAATFTNVHTRKSVSAPVKLETAKEKFAQTAVETVMDGKTERVSSIELGGSTTTVEFGTGTAAQSSK
ncbi:MAG TPA: hypothetical protein VGF03_18190 [Bryobacteraceae bacterium]|jgi:hypothetical protein